MDSTTPIVRPADTPTMADDRRKTTIEVAVDTYQRLSARKTPGDSFDDVINRVLDELEDRDA